MTASEASAGRPLQQVATRAAAVLGAARPGFRPWRRTRCRLFDLQLDAEVAEVRRRVETTRAQKRRHDLMNAFTAVEGAASILTQDGLRDSDRSRVSRLLGSGVRRTRDLLLAEAGPDPTPLAQLTDSLAQDPDWPTGVTVDVAADLMVSGPPDELAETIRQLLRHACGRGPSSPVTIRGRRHGLRTELWVDDRGPRLSARERRGIREPGRRRPFGPVGVSALDVAIRLARGQDGEVRVEARPGGGESFGISWPAPRQ